MDGLLTSAKRKFKGLLSDAENLSIGLGHGISNQLEGMYQLGAHPVESAKAMYQAGKAVYEDPSLVGGLLKDAYQTATSGPLGLGLIAGENMSLRPRTPRGLLELKTYHGSPHRINNVSPDHPMGKFDLSKVGTGEGAQAYGHGIYLAESPDVARSYASDGGSSLLKARMLRDKAKKLRESATSDDLALAERLESQADGIGNGSNFYTVDLPDEHIAKMLDWDAPLSEQPEVLAAIRKAGWGDKVKDGMTGGDFVGKIPNDSRMYLSDDLARVGIPGIKYFDGGSRIGGEAAKIVENYGTVEKAIEVSRKRLSAASIVDRKHWQAIVNELEKPRTRNFVIFDPEVATILSRE